MPSMTSWKVGGVAMLASLLACGPVLAAGVTIVMHGWNPVVGSGEPAWTGAMQEAISDTYLGGEERFGTITGAHGNLTATCSPWNVDLTSSPSGEIVIRVDWSAVADHFTPGAPAQEVAAMFEPHGFLRVHREWVVNLHRVALLRLREGGRDWEPKMAPPVNQLVPVSRNHLDEVRAAFWERPPPG